MGSVNDNTEAMKNKKYTARRGGNFGKLTKLISENPSTSQRTNARRIGVSQMTTQFTQPLNEDYKQKILVFAQNMKPLIKDDGINVKQIFFSDEANFYLHRRINKKN